VSTIIHIDLGALTANYRLFRDSLARATCAAVVKADAYGLGIRSIAPALSRAGCKQFFTATHAEGVVLRKLLPEAEIYILEGATPRGIRVLTNYALTPVLITLGQSEAWAAHARALGRRLPSLVNIDTGMTRLGFSRDELLKLAGRADILDHLDIRYVMTHFSCADESGARMVQEQKERFNELRRLLPDAPTSIGNSAGAWLGGPFAGDMARVGIALFGGNPYLEDSLPVRPVLRIQSRILQVRDIDEPTPVGYGATYTAEPGTRIATVGTGYADGYPWSLGNRGVAAIDGHRVPVVGRVSMDLITLDVTGLPDELVQPGSLVDLIGPEISLEEVADLAGTINYEILTRLSQRATRNILPETA
jgi:alanine racemase